MRNKFVEDAKRRLQRKRGKVIAIEILKGGASITEAAEQAGISYGTLYEHLRRRRNHDYSLRLHTIYALAYPDTDTVFYVGAAVNERERYKEHLARKSHSKNLDAEVKSILQSGRQPKLIILESNVTDPKRSEKDWIQRMSCHPLVNKCHRTSLKALSSK